MFTTILAVYVTTLYLLVFLVTMFVTGKKFPEKYEILIFAVLPVILLGLSVIWKW